MNKKIVLFPHSNIYKNSYHTFSNIQNECISFIYSKYLYRFGKNHNTYHFIHPTFVAQYIAKNII